MMFAELLGKVAELVSRGNALTVQKIAGNEREVILVQGDSHTFKPVDPPKRNATLFGRDDIVKYTTDPSIAKAPEVYVHGEGVSVILDRNDRREIARVPFAVSAIGATLKSLALNSRSFSVKDAVRFMRLELCAPPAMIAPFRRIDFTRTSSGTNDVKHGRESLGRSVEAAVQNAEGLPESFVLKPMLYTSPGFDHAMIATVRVDVDFDESAIVFDVAHDDLTDAINNVHLKIIADLRQRLGDSIPVFSGGP